MCETSLVFLNLEIIQVANIHHKLFNFTVAFSVHSLYTSVKYSDPALETVFKVI